ncbi:MAG: hypothetical protein OXK79_13215 [Chloroflexota bacterium]|nr:hypothetical protein [Chloroflexota bacterium]
MSTSMSGGSPGNKTAGMALALGVILSFFAVLLYPGGVLIDPVDQTNFSDAVNALADNANLAHAMTLLFILAILMEAYGLLALFQLIDGKGSLANAALRFGIGGIVFSWILFIFELGTRHMAVHIMTHGVGGQVAESKLEDFAVTVYSVGGAAHIAFLSVGSVAAIFLGLGLASRFATMNIYKLAAYGTAFVVGLGGLLNLGVVQHIHDIDLNLITAISNVILSIGALCYFIFGLGMYFGRSEFAADDASG